MSFSDKLFDNVLSDKILVTVVDDVLAKVTTHRNLKNISIRDHEIEFDHFIQWRKKHGYVICNEIIVFAYFHDHKLTWDATMIRSM